MVAEFVKSIFGGTSMKEFVVATIIIIVFYSIMLGSSLLSRLAQIFALVTSAESYDRGYKAGGLNQGITDALISLAIFFAPLFIKYGYRLLKLIIVNAYKITKGIILRKSENDCAIKELEKEIGKSIPLYTIQDLNKAVSEKKS